jgi:NAD(P)-dependent dehydrogenase (short-subunit alcohol dehydrogenase family)
MKRLEGKVAVITGGGQGIGRAAALLFAREAAVVVVTDLNEATGGQTAADIAAAGGRSLFVPADVSRGEDVQRLMAAVRERFGGLHVLYNNASVYWPGKDGRIAEISEADWDRILAINLRSIFLCCKYGLPLMKAGGSIINTSSSAGVIGIPGCDAYTASKGATIALTRSLAVEYRPFGIRVNCIAPAGIRTPMLAQSNLEDSAFDERHFLALRTPSRRYGTPEEIAQTALFLASEESSYINGAVIVADGGITVNGDLSKAERG